jgi:hypothetical protein
VSLAANRNIFGGFIFVESESSRKGKRKRDPDEPFAKIDVSQKSFLVTLNNPHNITARRFALKDEAIWCDSQRGPDFSDMTVQENCNANANSLA